MRRAIFDGTGDILFIVSGSEAIVDGNTPADALYAEVDTDVQAHTHYMENHKARLCQDMNLDTTENGHIQSIPRGTKVRWPDGKFSTESGGSISFDANASTEFWFGFTHPKFLDKTLKVTYVTS